MMVPKSVCTVFADRTGVLRESGSMIILASQLFACPCSLLCTQLEVVECRDEKGFVRYLRFSFPAQRKIHRAVVR